MTFKPARHKMKVCREQPEARRSSLIQSWIEAAEPGEYGGCRRAARSRVKGEESVEVALDDAVAVAAAVGACCSTRATLGQASPRVSRAAKSATSELAVLDDVEHRSAIARHALRCTYRNVRRPGTVPQVTRNCCSCCSLDIISNVERAPHPLPHHPPPLRHLSPAKHQGHA